MLSVREIRSSTIQARLAGGLWSIKTDVDLICAGCKDGEQKTDTFTRFQSKFRDVLLSILTHTAILLLSANISLVSRVTKHI